MNIQNNNIGVFGKLPAHGDFIQRNLPAGFINVWDDWLQHFVAGTKEQLGDNWLDLYLTSPVWRFVFSEGVIDENNWAGIMIPSVDRVGRYYPFSIVKKLPHTVNPFEFIQTQASWYKEIESLALDALDGAILLDDLVTQLEDIKLDYRSGYIRSGSNFESDGFQFDMEFEEQSSSTVYPLLLDAVMGKLFQSYSVWQTTGSDCIKPCVFSSQGLPSVQKMPAMLNGDWQGCSWNQAFTISELEGIGTEL